MKYLSTPLRPGCIFPREAKRAQTCCPLKCAAEKGTTHHVQIETVKGRKLGSSSWLHCFLSTAVCVLTHINHNRNRFLLHQDFILRIKQKATTSFFQMYSIELLVWVRGGEVGKSDLRSVFSVSLMLSVQVLK